MSGRAKYRARICTKSKTVIGFLCVIIISDILMTYRAEIKFNHYHRFYAQTHKDLQGMIKSLDGCDQGLMELKRQQNTIRYFMNKDRVEINKTKSEWVKLERRKP